jgi:hypothetical protein
MAKHTRITPRVSPGGGRGEGHDPRTAPARTSSRPTSTSSSASTSTHDELVDVLEQNHGVPPKPALLDVADFTDEDAET